MKALEKDRARRYATANELADDVRRFLSDDAILARPPSRGYRLRKLIRKNKGPAFAATAVFATLLLGIAATSTALFVANKERRRATLEANNAKSANENALEIIMQDAFAFALSGDNERTESFISRAEAVGADELQVSLLRAAAAQRTNPHDSAVHRRLEHILKVEPTNLPAKALLAYGYHELGRYQRFADLSAEVAILEPRSGIDYSILSYIMHFNYPDQAVEFAKKGLEEHDSGLSRYYYSRALSKNGLVKKSMKILDDALKQAKTAQLFLGSASMGTHARIEAADRLHYVGSSKKYSAAKLEQYASEGDLAVEELLSKKESLAPLNLIDIAQHFEHVRNDDARAEEVYELCMSSSIQPWPFMYAALKLKKDGPEAALAVYKRCHAPLHGDGAVLATKAIIEILNGDADSGRKTYQQFLNAEDYSACLPTAAVIPILLGDKDEAKRILERGQDISPFFLGGRPSIEMTKHFLLNTVDVEQFLASVPNDPEDLTCTHFIIGLKLIADKKWEQALKHFRIGAECCWPFHEFNVPWCEAIVTHMTRDSNWPVGRTHSHSDGAD